MPPLERKTKAELEGIATEHGVVVEQGTGKSPPGSVTKGDLVGALRVHFQRAGLPEAHAGSLVRARVLARRWNGHARGSVLLVPQHTLDYEAERYAEPRIEPAD